MNRLEIEFCTQCRWLLRATWVAQELLTTFPDELQEVTLKPGKGGAFIIRLNGAVVSDRKADGGFPDLGELKRKIRDQVAPERSLGHTDQAADE